MPKSATEVMHDILTTAAIDVAVAIKGIEGGLPNAVVRALGAIHPNTAVADLPKEMRDAVEASVRAAFTRLLKEGFVVVDRANAPPARPAPRDPAAQTRRSSPPGDRPGPRPPRRTDAPGERTGPRPPRGPSGPKRGGGKPPR